MYPTDAEPRIGVFVRNIENILQKTEFEVDHAVKYGNTKSFFVKTWRYLLFFCYSIYRGVTGNYNIIYVHYVAHSAIPALLIKFFKRQGKFVFHVHGSDILEEPKFFYLFTALALRIADLVIVPSDYFKEITINKFGLERKKVQVFPSGGVDTSTFKIMDIDRKEYLPDYREEFVIGFVSRIDLGKGWDVFLNAINKLKKELNKPFRGVIIGDGKEVDDMLRLKEELALNDVLDYLGPKSHKQLPYFYNCFDIFVFPTQKFESLGLVGLEAMSCGVPVIGSRIGALPFYIKEGRNGFLFTQSSLTELCGKIVDFHRLGNRKKKAMQELARQTALEYDANKVGLDLIRCFKRLISSENLMLHVNTKNREGVGRIYGIFEE